MDTRIALAGQSPDVYGALMRGWQGGEQRIQDVNAQQDRQALHGALAQRYANDPTAGVLGQTPQGQGMLNFEQQQAQYQAEQQKYQTEQNEAAGPVMYSIAEQFSNIPEKEREAAAQHVLSVMDNSNPTVARAMRERFTDLSNAGIQAVMTGYSTYAPKPKQTSAMTNAAALGYEPGTPEYNDFIKTSGKAVEINMPSESVLSRLNKPPSGYAWELSKDTGDVKLNDDGQPTMVQISGAPISGEERKAAYAATSLQSYETDLADVMKTYPDFDPANGWNPALIGGNLTNWLASPAYQQYRAIAGEWTANTVMLQSGQTATQEEKDSKFRNFFPQPSDDPATVKRKELLRRQSTQRALSMAGRGVKSADEKKMFYGEVNGKRITHSWSDVVSTAEENGITPQQVIDDLNLKEK